MDNTQIFLKIREGVAFHPAPTNGSKVEFILSTPDGRHFKVSQMAKTVLEMFNGQRDLAMVADALNNFGLPLSVAQLGDLVASRFRKMGIFEGDTSEQQQSTELLFLHWRLISPKIVNRLSGKLVFFFRPFMVALCLGMIVYTHWLTYGLKAETLLHFTDGRISPHSYLAVFLLMILSVLFHELGHATALVRKQVAAGGIGFGLFVLLPTFYADVSAVWRLQSKDRVIVDLGGVYFQLICSAVYCYFGILFEIPELIVTCHVIDAIILLNLNPFFQFDGYWCLVDYLNIPKLQRVALSFIKGKAKNLVGKTNEVQVPELSRIKLTIFKGYAFISVILIAVFAYISYTYLARVATSYPKAIPHAFHQMVADGQAGLWFATLADGLLFIFLLSIPTTCFVGVVLMCHRLAKALISLVKRLFEGVPHEHRSDSSTSG